MAENKLSVCLNRQIHGFSHLNQLVDAEVAVLAVKCDNGVGYAQAAVSAVCEESKVILLPNEPV